MQLLKIIFIIMCAVYFCFYTYYAYKTGRPFKVIIFYALLGAILLFVINKTSQYTGVCIDINVYTLIGSCATSLPGIITFLLLNLIFMI